DEERHKYNLHHRSRTNPTLVNGKAVQAVDLNPNDTIQLGMLTFKVVRRAGTERPRPEVRATPTAIINSGLQLAVVDGPDRGSIYSLDQNLLMVGRREGMDDVRGLQAILLNDDSLPREQIMLGWNERERTFAAIQVETSPLPTVLYRNTGGRMEQMMLEPGRQVLLAIGDSLLMGNTTLLFHPRTAAAPQPAPMSPVEPQTVMYPEAVPPRPTRATRAILPEGGRNYAPEPPPQPQPQPPPAWPQPVNPQRPAPGVELLGPRLSGESAAGTWPQPAPAQPVTPAWATPTPTPAWNPPPAMHPGTISPPTHVPLLMPPGPLPAVPAQAAPVDPGWAQYPFAAGWPAQTPAPAPPPQPEPEHAGPTSYLPNWAATDIETPKAEPEPPEERPIRRAPSGLWNRSRAARPADSPPVMPLRKAGPQEEEAPVESGSFEPEPEVAPAEEPEVQAAPELPIEEPSTGPGPRTHLPWARATAARRAQRSGVEPGRARPAAPAVDSVKRSSPPTEEPLRPPTPDSPQFRSDTGSRVVKSPRIIGEPSRPVANPPRTEQRRVLEDFNARVVKPPTEVDTAVQDEPLRARPLEAWTPPASAVGDEDEFGIPPGKVVQIGTRKPMGGPRPINIIGLGSSGRGGPAPASSTPRGTPPRRQTIEDEDDADDGLRPPTGGWRYQADYVIGFLDGGQRGQKIELLSSELEEGREISIGRKGSRYNEIELEDPTVANDQAILRYHDGHFSVLNQSRTRTIQVNKLVLESGEEILLRSGDRITLGTTRLIFLERSTVEALLGYELVVMTGAPDEYGKRFDIIKERMQIGRGQDCDIVTLDEAVSRKHATLLYRGGDFFVEHESVSNPTFVNGISLPKGRERQLQPGDRIQVSRQTTLLFRQKE
ncbi:MAG: FHA domain-containing protein, partial [Candidatus Xenobia bacterium]